MNEAEPTQAERDAFEEMREAIADRDRWKADAERLAAALRPFGREQHQHYDMPCKACAAVAALAAHDALTAETETEGK
jgi:hypothetical protein